LELISNDVDADSVICGKFNNTSIPSNKFLFNIKIFPDYLQQQEKKDSRCRLSRSPRRVAGAIQETGEAKSRKYLEAGSSPA